MPSKSVGTVHARAFDSPLARSHQPRTAFFSWLSWVVAWKTNRRCRLAYLWLVVALLICNGCNPGNDRSVIIYTSQDQQFAEPILNDFKKQTGIKVRAVYD